MRSDTLIFRSYLQGGESEASQIEALTTASANAIGGLLADEARIFVGAYALFLRLTKKQLSQPIPMRVSLGDEERRDSED